MVGKPSAYMANTALALAGVPAADCLMIGDRLETDVLMGVENGMGAALTLTGATSRAEAENSNIKPDYILETLGDLLNS